MKPNTHIAGPVVQSSALDRFEELRKARQTLLGKPSAQVLDKLPPDVRQPLLLIMELIGEDMGYIPFIFVYPHKNSAQARKEKKARHRKLLQDWLMRMSDYVRLFHYTALYITAAEIAVRQAITDIDEKISNLSEIHETRVIEAEAQSEDAGSTFTAAVAAPVKEIQVLEEQKAELVELKTKVLPRHKAALTATKLPTMQKLGAIVTDIRKRVKIVPAMRAAFEYVIGSIVTDHSFEADFNSASLTETPAVTPPRAPTRKRKPRALKPANSSESRPILVDTQAASGEFNSDSQNPQTSTAQAAENLRMPSQRNAALTNRPDQDIEAA